MSTTRVTLDFYNSSLGIDIDGISHVFSSPANFLRLTSFPREESNIISFELERNMFFVEYIGGVTIAGDQTPEIKWISSNLELLKQAALSDADAYREPPHSIRIYRNEKLYNTDWIMLRHQDEVLAGNGTTLLLDQITQLAIYRQNLRNMSSEVLAGTDPDAVTWPTVPSFLA